MSIQLTEKKTKMNRSISILFLLLHVVFHASSLDQLPVTTRKESEILPDNEDRSNSLLYRTRRKGSDANVDVSSPAVKYMIELRESLTDENGIPRIATDDPTNVWCLLDKDLVDEVQKQKPNNKRCRIRHQFHYSMKTLFTMLQQREVVLQKGQLRAYMDVIRRYFKRDDTIDILISTSFLVTQMNTSLLQTVFAGEQQMKVTAESSGWITLNVTTGLEEIQTISREINDTVVLEVMIGVNCNNQKKVPVILVDPATVPLTQGPRRARLTKLQPLLLVFLNDKLVKTEIEQESQPSEVGENIEVEKRRKREEDGCHLENFSVNFHNIDLTYILAPYEYNARKCVGLCDHSILRYQGNIATNHAKIMASSVAFRDYNPNAPFHHEPTNPCCVPTRYESLSLLIFNDINELTYAVYPTMTVTECGCR